MPNYKAHTIISLSAMTAAAYSAVTAYDVSLSLVWPAAIGFGVATLFLSPDLDLKYSSPTRNWMFLRWIWLPYQLAFKHRGLSHSILLSTGTRVLYLTGVLLALYMGVFYGLAQFANVDNPLWSVHRAIDFSKTQTMDHLPESLAVAMGIWLSDVCHIVADRVFSMVRSFAKL